MQDDFGEGSGDDDSDDDDAMADDFDSDDSDDDDSDAGESDEEVDLWHMSQRVYNWNVFKIIRFCFDFDDLVRSQICTCHDSTAVMACAKFTLPRNLR